MPRARLGLITLRPDDRYGELLCGDNDRRLARQADRYLVLRTVARGEWMRLASYLARLVNDLAAAGAEMAAIAAITPHACSDQMRDLVRIPLVDALDAIADELRSKELKRIAIFGGKLAMETDLFGRLGDIEIVRPATADAQRVRTIYVQFQEAQATPAAIGELERIAQKMAMERNIDAVVLAGSAFADVGNALRSNIPLLDASRIHVAAIKAALSRPHDTASG